MLGVVVVAAVAMHSPHAVHRIQRTPHPYKNVAFVVPMLPVPPAGEVHVPKIAWYWKYSNPRALDFHLPKSATALRAFTTGANGSSGLSSRGFSNTVRQMWPTFGDSSVTDDVPTLGAPLVPDPQRAVGIADAFGGFSFVGIDALGFNRSDNAQSLAWTSSNKHVFADVQRVNSSIGDVDDVTQTTSVLFDNGKNIGFASGFGSEHGSRVNDPGSATLSYYAMYLYGSRSGFDAHWSSIGPQYDPENMSSGTAGTDGYTLRAHERFGKVTVSSFLDRYRDVDGELRQADQGVKVAMRVTRRLNLNLTTGSNYADDQGSGIRPYSKNGLGLSFSGPVNGAFAYQAGAYDRGFVQQSNLSTGVRLHNKTAFVFTHQQTNFFGTPYGPSSQIVDAFNYVHPLSGGGSFTLGYIAVNGNLPSYLALYQARSASITFAFDKRVPFGTMHLGYSNPNALNPHPTFTFKIVPGQ